MSVRKEDHLIAIIGMDILNNCHEEVKSSLKVILALISSQNNSV